VDKPLNLLLRGEALWDSVTAERDFDAAGYALLEDACRTADIITRLSDMLDTDEEDWLRIMEDTFGKSDKEKRVIVNVRPLLGEIRQQRLAMNRLLNQLGIGHIESDDDPESRDSRDFWSAKESEFKKG
jgi:hypothetical protein